MLVWLLVFLGVAVTIQARQTAAVLAASRVARLREERTALEAQRAALERKVRLATSRRELGSRAESVLELHFPSDSEFVYFPLAQPSR